MSLMRHGCRIAITSGKGGVGKTSVTVHLAAALAAEGRRVGVVDADFALGNVDVLLGLSPTHHLGHVIAGDRSIDEVIMDGPANMKIVPAGSGVRSLTSLNDTQFERLSVAINDFASTVDVLLLDTATGIADIVLDVVALADCALVVTTLDPAALVDAYAVVKLVDAIEDGPEIGVLVNATRRQADADTAYRQLSLVADRFLGRQLFNAGAIAMDPDVRAAGRQARVLNPAASQASARRGFQDLARRLAAWPSASRQSAAARPPRAADLAARLRSEASPCA